MEPLIWVPARGHSGHKRARLRVWFNRTFRQPVRIRRSVNVARAMENMERELDVILGRSGQILPAGLANSAARRQQP